MCSARCQFKHRRICTWVVFDMGINRGQCVPEETYSNAYVQSTSDLIRRMTHNENGFSKTGSIRVISGTEMSVRCSSGGVHVGRLVTPQDPPQ